MIQWVCGGARDSGFLLSSLDTDAAGSEPTVGSKEQSHGPDFLKDRPPWFNALLLPF